MLNNNGVAIGTEVMLGSTGLAIDDGAGNSTTTTLAGTTVTNAAGDTTTVAADGTTVTNAAGDSTTVGAGNISVADANGNETAIGATQVVVGGANGITLDGNKGVIGGLTNTTFDPNNVTSGQAATEDQLKQVSDVANAGWTVADANGNSNNIGPNGKVTFNGDSNITVTESGDDNDGAVNVALNRDLDLDSVTTGNTVINNDGVSIGNTVQLGGTGLVIQGGPSITVDGINAGNKTITNVAAGVNDTDAVNVGQLKDVSNQLDQLADNAVQYDDDSKGQVTLGGEQSTDGGRTGGTKITNVHQGDISEGSTDAVNGSQLYDTNKNVADNSKRLDDIQKGNAGYFQVKDTSKKGMPKPTGKDSTAGGAGAVASGNNSTALGSGAEATADNSVALGAGSKADRANSVSVGAPGSERQITNVAAGTKTTDAVNLGQLKDGLNDVQNWAQDYTDQRFNQLHQGMNQLQRKANAGIASAMAMASLPQAYQPDQSAAAVAVGNYNGESAIAVGVSTITDSGRYIFKVNASGNTRGDAGVGVGAAVVW